MPESTPAEEEGDEEALPDGQMTAPHHVVVGRGGIGTRFISKKYPVTDGLTAGTTKQEGHTENLVYEKTIVEKRNKVGL